MGASVGNGEGIGEGGLVGLADGSLVPVGEPDGFKVRDRDGCGEGCVVGVLEGFWLPCTVGLSVAGSISV